MEPKPKKLLEQVREVMRLRHYAHRTEETDRPPAYLNYAEPNDWSKPIATGQPNEVVVVLIKRVRVL
ncbi:hypothetical protein [Sphaerothrix gracilis]|uniref:hypothetical protein n=1 Tax=Sphaerothrix gracilis TaxID=3151835 RepID=UPI0031FD4EDF